MFHIINRGQGVQYHYPELIHGVDFQIENRNDETGEEDFIWMNEDIAKPSEAELEEWSLKAQAVFLRKHNYKSIAEQMDALWHDIDDGKISAAAKKSSFYLMNKEVKDAFPKKDIK